MSSAVPVLAIDGPTGSGKGTVSRGVARLLGWHLLDSGALYRLVALAAERRGVDLEDAEALARIAVDLDVRFAAAGQQETVYLDGEDVTEALRTEHAGRDASRAGAHPPVREALLARQRGFAQPPGLVADGRDMGTVVFPDALLKVFLTAEPAERAARRHKQLREKGISVSLASLSREIVERDRRDATRPIAPLQPAGDARVLDSTRLSAEQVIDRIMAWLQEATATKR
ncbi:MAG TPA: (d)CMP kinase [Gammaproteobacteria bacterium]|nr:(d)CMP kinase [Gammaproteobacteria bacterium]